MMEDTVQNSIATEQSLEMEGNDSKIRMAIEEMGYDKLSDLQTELDQWKTIQVKIAIIGQSGVGKSTFMNKIRGLTPRDKNKKDSQGNDLYAKVGLTETTTEVLRYEFEENPLIELFDLPGAGTETFPIDSYPDKVGITQFDAFVLLTASRFHENDMKILQEIKKLGRPFFFGRTKTDHDVQDLAAENPEEDADTFKQSWEHAQEEIKKDCMHHLKDMTLGNVFLLSRTDYKTVDLENEETIKIEFHGNQRLKNTIIESLPVLQKTALLFSLGADTKELIRMKVKELGSRIWKIALISAGAGAVPLPGFSLVVDISLIERERAFQKKQLGIDESSLNKKAELLSMIKDDLITAIKKKNADNTWMGKILDSLLEPSITINQLQDMQRFQRLFWQVSKYSGTATSSVVAGTSDVIESVFRYIPGIGSMAAAAISGGSTYLYLSKVLSMNKETAEKCLEIMRDHFRMEAEQ